MVAQCLHFISAIKIDKLKIYIYLYIYHFTDISIIFPYLRLVRGNYTKKLRKFTTKKQLQVFRHNLVITGLPPDFTSSAEQV